MIIDFKELPLANDGNPLQDSFELFSRDFLVNLGYQVICEPSRGPDGKKDMIVQKQMDGAMIKWLVSCKHNAHSNKAVRDTDEPDISDRIIKHKCHGFIGIYSSVPASSLVDKLRGNEEKVAYQIFDREKIEATLLENPRCKSLIVRYFPQSFEKNEIKIEGLFKKKDIITEKLNRKITQLSFGDIIEASKTGSIIVEIEKLKEEYYSSLENRANALNKIYKFSDHSNPIITAHVYSFLEDISHHTRGGLNDKMTEDIASSILSLIIVFFPYPKNKNKSKSEMEIADRCCEIAFNIAYDSIKYLKDYSLVMTALNILKFINLRSKHYKWKKVLFHVDEIYIRLKNHFNSSEYKNFLELMEVFKEDKEKGNLCYPALSDALYKVIYSKKLITLPSNPSKQPLSA